MDIVTGRVFSVSGDKRVRYPKKCLITTRLLSEFFSRMCACDVLIIHIEASPDSKLHCVCVWVTGVRERHVRMRVGIEMLTRHTYYYVPFIVSHAVVVVDNSRLFVKLQGVTHLITDTATYKVLYKKRTSPLLRVLIVIR